MPASTFAPRQNMTASTSTAHDHLHQLNPVEKKAYDTQVRECCQSSGPERVHFDMPASTFAPQQNTTASTSAPDDLLDHFLLIQHKACDELKKECRRLVSEQGRTLWTLYPQAALSYMSEELPETKEEMLKLPHVTKANYEKYGRHLLPITNKYYRERQHIKMNFQDKEMPHSFSEPPSKRPRWGS